MLILLLPKVAHLPRQGRNAINAPKDAYI